MLPALFATDSDASFAAPVLQQEQISYEQPLLHLLVLQGPAVALALSSGFVFEEAYSAACVGYLLAVVAIRDAALAAEEEVAVVSAAAWQQYVSVSVVSAEAVVVAVVDVIFV